MPSPSIRPAQPSDAPAILTLLAQHKLVTHDLTNVDWSLFHVAITADQLVGVIGLQAFLTSGLIRSLSVTASAQNHGLGRSLLQAALDHAHRLDVSDLYLLTTTAAPFFEKFGFESIDRDQAPPAIRSTPEFTALCPSSAVVMHRHI